MPIAQVLDNDWLKTAAGQLVPNKRFDYFLDFYC
jgi:hypothetical protein